MKLFTNEELRDIIVAVVTVTLIFSIKPLPYASIDYGLLPVYFVAVVIAFLFHELAHKAVAMKLHCSSRYKLWPHGLLFGLLLTFFGWKFVAPGAVVVQPFKFGRWGFRRSKLTTDEEGLIALSGLSVNLFFAGFFRLFSGSIASYLSFVNSWLFLFNLLPLPPLDGSKIVGWKLWFWAFLFIVGLFLVVPYLI